MKGDLKKTFASVLKELRKESGLSQQELADYSNLERVYISRLERSIQMPSLDTVFRISEVFKVKPSEFMQRMERRAKIA